MSTQATAKRGAVELPNTMGLPSVARHVVYLRERDQLPQLQALFNEQGMPVVLAGASNVILPDEVTAPVVLVRNLGIELVGQRDDCWVIDVAAGENWHQWVCYSLAQGWFGLENLALIPGSVGAAPIQNIGAYGVELEQRVPAVEIWHFDLAQARWIDAADCCFGYRDSVFKQPLGRHWLILTVRFALPTQWQPVLGYPDLADLRQRHQAQAASVSAAMVFDHVVSVRQAKLPDPAVKPNVGSFFKNPVVAPEHCAQLKQMHPAIVSYRQSDGRFKLAAAWLIDQCGFKGQRFGPVAVHERQALVLINEGGAHAADVLRAARQIAAAVEARFGVRLEMEPVCLA